MHYSQSIYKTVFLSDIVDIQIGKTPSRNQKKYWGVGFPWVSISDLNGNEEINYTKEQITLEAINETGIKVVPKGTIIFSFKLSIGKVAITGQDIYTNEAIAAFKIKNSNIIDQRFLYYVLREFDFKGTGDKAVMGLTLNQKKLKELKIPLPPLSTQKKIAAILEKADALRQNDKKILEKYDQLAGSVFLEMFGDPVRNEKGWEEKSLSELLDFLTSGSRGWARYYSETGDIFLRIQNIGYNFLKLADLTYVDAPESTESKRTRVQEGDIILSITADLGRTAVIPANFPIAYINQHLAILRLKKEYSPFYISQYLSSPGGSRQFNIRNKGGVKAGLNFTDIKSIIVPLPPNDLQLKYQKTISVIDSQKKLTQSSFQKSEELFQSLLQRAFRGGLG